MTAAAYAKVQALTNHTTIRVEKLEVTLHPPQLDQRDVHFDRTGYVPDAVLQDAYQLLAELHAQELYDIACDLVEGRQA